MIELFLAGIGTVLVLRYLNRKYPLDGPFEVTNFIGRTIAISILVTAVILAVQRVEW